MDEREPHCTSVPLSETWFLKSCHMSQLLGWLRGQTLQATGNDNIDLCIYSRIYHNQSDSCCNDNDFPTLLITFTKVCIYWTFSIPRGTCLGEINKWNITSRYHLSCLSLFSPLFFCCFVSCFSEALGLTTQIHTKTDMSCVFALSL